MGLLSSGISQEGKGGKTDTVNTMKTEPYPTFKRKIGKTTYVVRVHFSETSKETMEDKIKRLLREEVRRM